VPGDKHFVQSTGIKEDTMKLIRYGPIGQERPGIVDSNGNIRDLSEEIADVSGEDLLQSSLDRLREVELSTLPRITGRPRIGACIGQIGKFICIGLNYSDHAAEAGMKVPEEPVIFMKATSAICGPNDDVVIPRGSRKTDWEVELGVVIGRPAKYVSAADALSHVSGYCVINDVSERSFQLESTGQWTKGKSADTFGPIGPWLVTADEIADPQNLDMWLEVNGRRFQSGNTRTMVFGVAHLISYLSQYMSLQPGDIISTGTPPGVGMGQRPPIYLAAGDSMELGIQGLGVQRQKVVAESAASPQ
jgi:2-keto-4-pentenoate hydratase/2-oxohepta-3-ene-1,7-dioic acid hydratase in catechol pathway